MASLSLVGINPKPQRRPLPRTLKTTATSLPVLQERPRLPPAASTSSATVKPTRRGDGGEDVLRLMDALRVPVDADVYATLLRDCAAKGDADDLRRVHDHIRRSGARLVETLLMQRLLLAYVATGEVFRALELFDEMPIPERDWVSRATMVAGLSTAGDHAGALRMFAEMVRERGVDEGGVRLASVVAALVLRGCGETGNAELGRCVHGLVMKMGLVLSLGRSLARLYCLLGREDDARNVLIRPGRARASRRRP